MIEKSENSEIEINTMSSMHKSRTTSTIISSDDTIANSDDTITKSDDTIVSKKQRTNSISSDDNSPSKKPSTTTTTSLISDDAASSKKHSITSSIISCDDTSSRKKESTSSSLINDDDASRKNDDIAATKKQSTTSSTTTYILYKSRWPLLCAVTLLNLANYSHWISFASVAKHAAAYYDVSGPEIDLIPTLSYGLCIPFCMIAVYVVERRGLRTGLMLGAWLTTVGGALCCLSTLPSLWDDQDGWWDRRTSFTLTVLGQALTGMACPFISCVPTKVSQNWFGESERSLATLVLAMSNPLGIVLGQSITPLFVTDAATVPLLNLIWFLPAFLGFLLTIVGVGASLPPTPPSHSATTSAAGAKKPFLTTIKRLVNNKPYIIIFLFLGGAMGYISAIQTKLEQMLCSRGYSDQLAGLSASMILIAGFLAAFPLGYISMKTGKMIPITKSACVPAIFILVIETFILGIPDIGWAVILVCTALGICSLGIYPIMLELSVETTFPLDESVVTGLIYLSSAIQGVILMAAENVFHTPMTTPEELAIQTCFKYNKPHLDGESKTEVKVESHLSSGGHLEPQNYTNYLIFLNIYMFLLILLYIVFFKTEYKRANEELRGGDNKGDMITVEAGEVKHAKGKDSINENINEESVRLFVNLTQPED